MIIDLERALLLHDLGNAWREVADAMGIERGTIYNHLAEAGLSSARKEWTVISDADLGIQVRDEVG
jgi:DNA invertase Pin-like site-specific DNA recombinase